MLRIFRVLLGIAVLSLLFGVASSAVRDCEVAPFVYENCAWLDVRDVLALPQSKVLRGALLQAIGLILLGGILMTWRYLFLRRGAGTDDRPANDSRPVGGDV